METAQIQYYQITKDGETNTIFNGVPDWVYEGKVFQVVYVFFNHYTY